MVAMLDLIVTFFSIVILVAFLQKWRSTSTSGKALPPSPRKLPIIGNLHQLGQYPHRSLQSLSQRYGQVMLLHFGNVPVVVASSAAAAAEILKKQDLIFSSRPKLSIPDRIIYGSRDVAFVAYGDYWRQMRSICVLQLLSNKRVQSFRAVREEETSIMVERIQQLGRSSKVVNLSNVLIEMTNDVICRVALGRKYDGDGGEERRFKKFLIEFAEVLGASPVGDFIPWLAWVDGVVGLDAKVKRVATLFDQFLEEIVREHRDREKVDGELDFADILLQFQRENKETSPIEDEAIKALLLDMFAGGTHTTFTTSDWAMAELIRNPRSMKTLQNEVREVGRGKKEIDEGDLEKMPYLKAAIKESLRLHAPVPLLVPRQSTKDTKLLGYDIVSGTRVVINAWAIGRDPSLWENPEKFYPERFLESSIDFKGLHFELLPFGAGRRSCPGIAFAAPVIELAIAKLINKFNFRLPDGGGKAEELDMSEAFGITMSRKHPLLVVV